MTRRAALLVIALLGASCASGLGLPLRAPPITGGHPAVGKPLRLDVEGATGAPVRIEAVAGRVTIVCLSTRAEDHAPCSDALARHGDGVAALAVTSGPVEVVGLRRFIDPGFVAARRLELRAPSIILTDRQRRIVQVIEPPDGEALERSLGVLLVGIHSPAR